MSKLMKPRTSISNNILYRFLCHFFTWLVPSYQETFFIILDLTRKANEAIGVIWSFILYVLQVLYFQLGNIFGPHLNLTLLSSIHPTGKIKIFQSRPSVSPVAVHTKPEVESRFSPTNVEKKMENFQTLVSSTASYVRSLTPSDHHLVV